MGRLPFVPAGFFGVVLGFGGLAGAWRAAHRVWGLPAAVGEAFGFVALVVWFVVSTLFVLKWFVARDAALAETRHPVHAGAITLAGVSTMLVATLVLPYARTVAIALFAIGFVAAGTFGLWQTGIHWRGQRPVEATTPIMYLPTVGPGFVSAIGFAALGETALSQVAFGVGVFSWLSIESVVLHRLITSPPMPSPLRPTLGIQLAPPTLGGVAYLAINPGPPDWFAHAMFGYGLLTAIVLLRVLPWIREQPFAVGYWGFTFGVTQLAIVPLRMIEKGDTGAVVLLAAPVFVACNVAMLVIVVATVRLILRGELLPVERPAG